jgi:hypothetical protein
MRLEMGHPKDDRVAMPQSGTNPSLSAILVQIRTFDSRFLIALRPSE